MLLSLKHEEIVIVIYKSIIINQFLGYHLCTRYKLNKYENNWGIKMCLILTINHFCVNISVLQMGHNEAKIVCDTKTFSDLVSTI